MQRLDNDNIFMSCNKGVYILYSYQKKCEKEHKMFHTGKTVKVGCEGCMITHLLLH